MSWRPGLRLRHRIGWIGVDEAGRGPLAGPVVAAAVFSAKKFPAKGIRDSKTMSPDEREAAALLIRKHCSIGVGIATHQEIDALNILQATFLAMRRALDDLRCDADGVRIDGKLALPDESRPCEAVVRGDGCYVAIAAAGIIAKTTRDAIMKTLHADYPVYGFDRHFGYATPEHLSAIAEHGPCEIHRRTFSPIQQMLTQPCLALE